MITFNRAKIISYSAIFTSILLGLALPTSVFLINVAFALILINLIINHKQSIRQIGIIKSSLIYIPLLMYSLLVISYFVHPHSYSVEMLRKYARLLYILPISLFFINKNKAIKCFVISFVIANLLIMLLSLFIGIFHFHILNINPVDPTIFRLHITQNFFIAITALILLSISFNTKTKWIKHTCVILFLLTTCNVLFIVNGRTGYLALAVGLISLFYIALPNKRILLIPLILSSFTLFLFTPNKMSNNIKKGINEIYQCHIVHNQYNNCDDSMGLRKSFIADSYSLIKQSPVFGHGVGAFHYKVDDSDSLHNPHNQYVLETVQTGLLGLTLLITWFISCVAISNRQSLAEQCIFLPIFFSYFAANLFNSFLLDYAESCLFVTVVAILAARVERCKPY